MLALRVKIMVINTENKNENNNNLNMMNQCLFSAEVGFFQKGWPIQS